MSGGGVVFSSQFLLLKGKTFFRLEKNMYFCERKAILRFVSDVKNKLFWSEKLKNIKILKYLRDDTSCGLF
jgi:hypothetical protein